MHFNVRLNFVLQKNLVALKESHVLLEQHVCSVNKHSEQSESLHSKLEVTNDKLQQTKTKYSEIVQQLDSEKSTYDKLVRQLNDDVRYCPV